MRYSRTWRSPARRSRYKETAQRIDLDALDKLCKLFDCEVGELLEVQRDK
ncbi:helix-turn-helix transcriptional regulator [Marinobacter pelagius]